MPVGNKPGGEKGVSQLSDHICICFLISCPSALKRGIKYSKRRKSSVRVTERKGICEGL